MTTPRVTVPVEPTEAMIDFASFHMVGAGAFTKEDRRLVVASVYRAMLSAATAPEGGVVDDVPRDEKWRTALEVIADCERERMMRRAGVKDLSREPLLGPPSDMAVSRILLAERPEIDRETADLLAVKINDALSALATREEAPAEAGEGFECDGCDGDRCVYVGSLCNPNLRAQPQEVAGPAEPEVGRAIYERIEKLLTDDPQGWERAYLSHLVASVEEVGGYDGPQAREEAQPVARVTRKGNITGSIVWTDHGLTADLPDETALFVGSTIENRGGLRAAIYDDLCAADNQDVPLEEYPERILSIVERFAATTPPAPESEKLRVAVEALEKASLAISAQYALAQAEYQHHDTVASKHDKIVQEGHRAIREALAVLQQEDRPDA